MWDAVNLLPLVCWIAQSVSVDDLMLRVRENWKVNRAFAIRRNFLGEGLARIRGIHADREQLYILVLLQESS